MTIQAGDKVDLFLELMGVWDARVVSTIDHDGHKFYNVDCPELGKGDFWLFYREADEHGRYHRNNDSRYFIKENEVEAWAKRLQTVSVAWYGFPSAFVVLGRLLNLMYPRMQNIGLELAAVGLNRFNIYRVTPVEIMGVRLDPEAPVTLDEFVEQEWPKFEAHKQMEKWMGEYMSLMVVFTPEVVLKSLAEKTFATYEKLAEGASEDDVNDLLWIKDAAEVMKKGGQVNEN